MKVRLSMEVRDQSGFSINDLYIRAGMPEGQVPEEGAPVWLRNEVEFVAVPRQGDEIDIGLEVDWRRVQYVVWNIDGSVDVMLSSFDTDEIGSEEEAFTELFEAGWEVELE